MTKPSPPQLHTHTHTHTQSEKLSFLLKETRFATPSKLGKENFFFWGGCSYFSLKIKCLKTPFC